MNKKLHKLVTLVLLVGVLTFVTLDQVGIIEKDSGSAIGWSLVQKQDVPKDLVIQEPDIDEPIDTPDTAPSTIMDYFTTPLQYATSNTEEGAVKYGATIVLGDLDQYGRSTFAHIQLKDEHEPGFVDPATGKPREKRNERINVDPAGWKNFKIDGKWANNRCHLIGYQFSGLNDELRNLATCTSYLNKGSEGSGTDQNNPDGMLFYEQKLDKWLSDNPSNTLDYHIKPIYDGDDLTPSAYYMQWVGFNDSSQAIAIDSLGGHAQHISGDVYGVLLQNMSPSYNVDTSTGIVSAK